MREKIAVAVLGFILASCGAAPVETTSKADPNQLIGTWQLVHATVIAQGDTTVTDYTKDVSFIKIINATHFAFLQHDLTQSKDTAVFVAGGGRYTLTDSIYTEQLEYCSAREWEGNDFTFSIALHGDTLLQRGIEKVDEAGVNRENIEMYIRLKK